MEIDVGLISAWPACLGSPRERQEGHLGVAVMYPCYTPSDVCRKMLNGKKSQWKYCRRSLASDGICSAVFKGIFHPHPLQKIKKNCHHLLMLMFFQTCMIIIFFERKIKYFEMSLEIFFPLLLCCFPLFWTPPPPFFVFVFVSQNKFFWNVSWNVFFVFFRFISFRMQWKSEGYNEKSYFHRRINVIQVWNDMSK